MKLHDFEYTGNFNESRCVNCGYILEMVPGSLRLTVEDCPKAKTLDQMNEKYGTPEIYPRNG